MKLGTLDRLCKLIRRFDLGQNDYGAPVFEEQTMATFWAALIYKREDEAFSASQRYAVRVVTFRTHHIDDVLETDLIECEGQTYKITGVRELGYRAGMDISATWRR